MQRYKLKAPAVAADGSTIREVIIRRPTRGDQAKITALVEKERARRAHPLDGPALSAIMVAQVIDLPIEVVRKFAVRDLRALHVEVTSAFAKEGMA
jgi:hypothetical protein